MTWEMLSKEEPNWIYVLVVGLLALACVIWVLARARGGESALEQLERRRAGGEISNEEYEELKRMIDCQWP